MAANKPTLDIYGIESRQLQEDNLNDWLMDIRALLRPRILWKYVTELYNEEEKARKNAWAIKAKETVDLKLPTIGPFMKRWITEEQFNKDIRCCKSLRKSGNLQQRIKSFDLSGKIVR